MQRTTAVLTLALVALGTACTRAPETALPLRTSTGARPNVLLVTVDTLRADHLGAYGYPVPTTPTIDGLAARGARFTRAIATAPETSPAMASLLSGLYQYRSRVLFNRGTLPPSVPTIAEWMQNAGYATACLVGNLLLTDKFGFAQGCAHFASFVSLEPWKSSDDHGVDAAIAWLDTRPAAPWFLWIHLMDPHGAYLSADPSWSKDFVYPPYMFGVDAPVPLAESNFGLGVIPKYQRIEGLTRPSEYLRRYDGEIRFMDAQVGRLLDALAARDAVADTLVIFTADHGESLSEHRELFQHGWYVYDTTIRVPLIVSWPGHLPAGRVVEDQVSGVDLVPTLMEALAPPTNEDSPPLFDGVSFAARLLADGDGQRTHVAYAVGARENHPFAVRWHNWKLVYTPAGRPPLPAARYPLGGFGTPERVELYDLDADPGELVNVAPKNPGIVELLRNRLDGFRATFRSSGPKW